MSKDINVLDTGFRGQIQELLTKCGTQGIEMRPFHTLRDPFEQARLWRQSRSSAEIQAKLKQLKRKGAPFLAHIIESVGPQHGQPVTNAIPGLSWHQWGEAIDCYWLLRNKAEWSVNKKAMLRDGRRFNGYRLYAEFATSSGLIAGGHWQRLKDWPHIQRRPAEVDHYYSLPEIDKTMQERFGEQPN
jgi:peptidoglycan LD-endopeptidase CwlK